MKQRFLALICAVSLVLSLLAGCQTVGGVDLEKVMQNTLNTVSYEGSGSLAWELETGAQEEGLPDMTALKKGEVSVTGVKQQDKEHRSMAGELRYGSASIPFQAYTAGDETVIQLKGADRPLLIGGKKQQSGGGAQSAMPIDLSNLDWTELLTKNGPSLVKYMPNPKSLTVKDAKATINGQELSLKQIHAELTGKELAELLQTGIRNLLADPEQDVLIKEIVGQVLGDNGTDLVKGFAVVFVKQYLREIADDVTKMGEFAAYLNDSNSFKLDLYADSDSQVRRIAYELKLGGLKEFGSVTGIKVTGTADRWNINQTVKADAIDAKGAADLTVPGQKARFIKGLEKNSEAYKLFVDDLKLTRKKLVLPPMQDGIPGETVRPYIDPVEEVTLVPVRFVTENLDAEVEWLADTRQVKVTDILSGKTLLFTIDSKTVLVDGKAVELEAGKAVLTAGSTYVPVRFIAEQFDAKVGWEPSTRVVSIIRN